MTSNSGLLDALLTPCGIASSIGDVAAILQCQALWDTGATGCVITEPIATQCGLTPIGVLQVFGVHGAEMVNAYLVNLHLPNDVVFENLRVTEGVLGDDIDVLIGMDVITRGDFAVTNKDGLTVFTFRIPSIARYDYVKEHEASERRRQRRARQRRRR